MIIKQKTAVCNLDGVGHRVIKNGVTILLICNNYNRPESNAIVLVIIMIIYHYRLCI